MACRIPGIGFSFFAVGDFGHPGAELEACVGAMCKRAAAWSSSNGVNAGNASAAASAATKKKKPAFVALLGDNYYPRGISSPRDPQIKRVFTNMFGGSAVASWLNVPYKIITGNHCLMQNTTANVELSCSEEDEFNPKLQLTPEERAALLERGLRFPTSEPRLWQSFGDDGVPGRNYKFSVPLDMPGCGNQRVDFFVLCTNAAQYASRRDDPGIVDRWPGVARWLAAQLAASDAVFKVVLHHQPCYTKGLQHGTVAACLRSERYTTRDGKEHAGLGLERILVEGGVDFSLAGHEHVSQCRLVAGVQHCGCGSPVELGYYGGASAANPMDWTDAEHHAFMHGDVFVEANEKSGALEAVMRIDFVAADFYNTLLHRVEKRKPLTRAQPAASTAAAAAGAGAAAVGVAVKQDGGGGDEFA